MLRTNFTARLETKNNRRYFAKILGGVRRFAFGAILLAATPVAWGGELSLLINGWAHHINPAAGTNYNERNWGAGLQYDFDTYREHWVPFVAVSGFSDSNRNMSYYAGGGIVRRFDVAPSWDDLHVDVGVVAFAMTRKDFNDDKPFLGALPALTIGTAHLSLNITYIPKVHPKLVALTFVQLKIPLSKY